MFSIGVDLGGTKIRVGVMNEQGQLLRDQEIPTQADRGPDPVIADIVFLVKEVLKDFSEHDLLGVGIGSPGPLNPRTGRILSPPNLPGWNGTPLRDMVQEATGLPTYLDNDANVAALAEHRYGAGQGVHDMVYITVSTGIGGGAIVNGRLVQGHTGAAAEFGHMIVDLHGPLCRCGNRGCLEAIASGTGIGTMATERFGRPLHAADVAQLAREGNEMATQILQDAFYALGVGVVNVMNSFDPALIVIGGGVSQIGDELFRTVRRVANEQGFRDKTQPVEIVPAALLRNSGVIGAAALPFAASENR